MVRKTLPALLLGVVLAACASAPKDRNAPPCRRVWVYWENPGNNHTGLLIARSDFPVPEAFSGPADAGGRRKLLLEERQGLPIVTDWVEVGFASGDYLRERSDGKQPDFWRILRGGPGVVYVRPFPMGRNPEDWSGADEMLRPVDFPEARYRELLNFVAGSFARDGGAAAPAFVAPAYGVVYPSPYEFSYRRFCNVWVLDALRAGGASIPGWVPESSQVRYWLKNGDPPSRACSPTAKAGG